MRDFSQNDLIKESNALLQNLLSTEDKMKFSLWLDNILEKYFDDCNHYDDQALYHDFCKKHPYTACRILMYKHDSDDSIVFLMGDNKTELTYCSDGSLTFHCHDFINKEEYTGICDLKNW